MKIYNRIYLGAGSKHAQECFDGSFIGVDFDVPMDLTEHLTEELRTFNAWFVPLLQERNPGKSKVAASLNGGALWRILKEMKLGDLAICPDGNGRYRIGEIAGDYIHKQGEVLPHRRPVKWLDRIIDKHEMSESLQNSAGSIGTISGISKYAEEIERLIGSSAGPTISVSDETVEDPSIFAMEEHLEAFLVRNWEQTELGQDYDIYTVDGETVGQQFPADGQTRMDILAISKDETRLLVIELKRGRSSDQVVGQTLRYMGYVQDELLEPGQSVEGAIIALEDDTGFQRALSMTPIIRFYRYRVDFSLEQS